MESEQVVAAKARRPNRRRRLDGDESRCKYIGEALINLTSLTLSILLGPKLLLFFFLKKGQLITGHLKSIKVWDVSSGEMAKKLQGHKNKVLCLAMSLSGRLISGSRDNTIKFWNIERGECLQTLTGHRIYSVNALAVGCFNGLMASGSGDNTIKIWDVETGECLQTLTGHTRPVSVLAMAKKGQLVSGSADETLRIWNYEFNGSRC